MENIPMGLGALAGPNTTFVRKFRYTLSSNSFNEIITQGPLEIDYLNCEMKFKVIEVSIDNKPIDAHKFMTAMIKWPGDEQLTLTAYDGIGKRLYERSFYGIKATAVKQTFDYASSDVAAVDFVLSFKTTKAEQ